MASNIINYITSKWQQVATNYKNLIIKDPDIASKMEAILRMISYFIQGKFPFSQELSELIYTVSNLLTLTNDEIYRYASKLTNIPSSSVLKIKRWLSVIEYIEVFIEVGSVRLIGDFGRWVVVLIVQILKATLRLILVLKHKDGIQQHPTIAPLKRDSKILPQANKKGLKNDTPSQELPVWKGERSGRFIRSLSADRRQFPNLEQYKVLIEQEPAPLSERQKLAEILYTIRPVVHILSMFTFGQNSWKPWLLSAFTDLSSLIAVGDTKKRTKQEQQEISRRYSLLLLYLLRSPCYDTYSKERVIAILGFLNRYIPGSSLIIGPLLEYLPYWQRTYFYNWMS